MIEDVEPVKSAGRPGQSHRAIAAGIAALAVTGGIAAAHVLGMF